MGKGRILLVVVLLAASMTLVLHTLFDSDGWARRQKARHDLETIRSEIDMTQTRISALRSEIKAMRERPAVQEQAVRDELGYVRPDEIVLEMSAR